MCGTRTTVDLLRPLDDSPLAWPGAQNIDASLAAQSTFSVVAQVPLGSDLLAAVHHPAVPLRSADPCASAIDPMAG